MSVEGAYIAVVLRADMVRSATLRQAIGDSRMNEVEGEVLRTLPLAVAEHGGAVLRDLGDGVSAKFSTARAALDAAATVHRRVGALSTSLDVPEPLRMRIGIAAGDVVPDGDDVRGRVQIEAARLEPHAPEGGTLCSETVRALASNSERYVFKRRPALELKGLEGAIDVREVVHPLADALAVPEALDMVQRFSFVGRSEALDALTHHWKRAVEGEGSMIVIEGEPGIGKTRLCRELAHDVDADGAIVLFGRCSERLRKPFGPFVEAFWKILRAAPHAAAELPATDDGALLRILPDLAALRPGLAVDLSGDSEGQRVRMLEAIVKLLRDLSRQVPVLFVIDDLQWIDESSAATLDRLLASLADLEIQIVATYRPMDANQDSARLVAQLQRDDQGTLIRLGGLSAEEIAEFGDRLLGSDLASIDEATLRRSTAGNPLLLGELLLEMRDWPDGATSLDVDQSRIPDLVEARLERLQPTSRALVRFAAVCGLSFDSELLVAALGKPPMEVVEALKGAATANLFTSFGGGSMYEFTHALIRDAVYATLDVVERSAAHDQLAEAIERIHANDLDHRAELLAFHFEHGSSHHWPKAIDYYRRAARTAVDKTAHDVAAALYRRALEVLARVPGDADELRCALLFDLGAEERRAGIGASRATLIEATDLALRLGDIDLAVNACLGTGRGIFALAGGVEAERVALLERVLQRLGPEPSRGRARILAALGAELVFDDDPQRSLDASDDALAVARELNEPATLRAVLGNRLTTLWRADRVDERLQLAAEIENMRLGLPVDRPGQFLVTDILHCQAAVEAGKFELARRLLKQTREAAESLHQPTALGYVQLRMASLAAVEGRFDEAERLARNAHELCARASQPDADVFLVGNLFGIRYQQGRLREILPVLEGAERSQPGIGAFTAAVACAAAELGREELRNAALRRFEARLDTLRFDLNWLAALAVASVAVAAGAEHKDLALRLRILLEPYGEQFADIGSVCFGSVAHYHGLLSAALNDLSNAEKALRRAVDDHRRVGAAPLIARSELELASVLHQMDAAAEADELVRRSLATASRLEMGSIPLRAAQLGLAPPPGRTDE